MRTALIVLCVLVMLATITPTAAAIRDPFIVCVTEPCGPQVPRPFYDVDVHAGEDGVSASAVAGVAVTPYTGYGAGAHASAAPDGSHDCGVLFIFGLQQGEIATCG